MARTSAAGWVKTIYQLALGEGMDARKLFLQCGLDPDRLNDPFQRYAQDNITRVWKALATIAANPAIGLKFGNYVSPGTFSVVGYVMLSSKTMLEGLTWASHYARFMGEGLCIELVENDDVYHLKFDGLGDQESIAPQAMEAKLSAFKAYAEWVLRGPIQPVAVHMKHAFLVEPSIYRDKFQCEVIENAAFTGYVLPRNLILRDLPTHDPLLLQQHRRMADDMAANVFQPLSLQVKSLLREWLSASGSLQARIADVLHMSTKTLQRRLQAENASFTRLLDETRYEAACAYLLQSHLPLQEVADLVGYADYSAFAKAFRRHSGMTPVAWRAEKT